MNTIDKMKGILKEKRGIAGLTFFLEVIITLFVIGILVMSFALSGAQILSSNGYQTSPNQLVFGESINIVTNSTLTNLSVVGYTNVVCTITSVANITGTQVIGTANYTTSNCAIQAVAGSVWQSRNWTANYTYTYTQVSDTGRLINNTNTALTSNSTTNFALYITMAGIVVLILMVVLIVRAVREGGLMGGEESA